MRKSCQANCHVRTLFDTNGDLHLLIAATTDISKNSELTVPFDFFDLAEFSTVHRLKSTGVNFAYCVCQCDRKKCALREAVNESSGGGSQDASGARSVRVKREEADEVEGGGFGELKVETKVAEEAIDVKKKSPGTSGKQRQNSGKSTTAASQEHEHDELNKSLVSCLNRVRFFER